eukprot:TRINITY_DN74210_c0_g1_i1.p1 TRINITY_DN74210_c0_g1~~TRINITY_DN74210_c0_g1_i1.p1  ORF type:complete len:778 (-),score=163.07 TRINITY_DN74210_c0_g1_i1:216-2549(-)
MGGVCSAHNAVADITNNTSHHQYSVSCADHSLQGQGMFLDGRCWDLWNFAGDYCAYTLCPGGRSLPWQMGHSTGRYCVHEQCTSSWMYLRRGWLVVCYGTAVLMIWFYIRCEQWICHNSSATEAMYIFACVTLVAASTLTAERLYDCKDVAQEIISQCVFIVTIYSLIRTSVHPRQVASYFHDEGGGTNTDRHALIKGMKWQRDDAPARGLYAQRKVNDAMFSVSFSETSFGNTQHIIYCTTVLVLLMLRALASDAPEMQVRKDPFFHGSVGVLAVLLTYMVGRDASLTFGYFKARRRCLKALQDLIAHGHEAFEKRQESLTFFLCNISVGTMLNIAPRAVALLTDEALEKELLTTLSKAVILDGMMKRGMGDRQMQDHARRLICSCHGRELTRLKNYVDRGGGFQNFYKLIYFDLGRQGIRDDVLRHLVDEAIEVRRDNGSKAIGIKLLSDIDDTIICSGGYPGGADKRYPKECVYPGALSLYRQIDEAVNDLDRQECNLVFISARPHLYKGIVEALSYKKFQALVDDGRMHVSPTLLPGKLEASLLSAILSLCKGASGWKAAGLVKYETYEHYRHLYGEYDFLFSGDDGQGDLLAGQLMLKGNDDLHMPDSDSDTDLKKKSFDSTLCPKLLAVMIHKVLPPGRRPLELDDWNGADKRLVFHKTFVGAALEVHRLMPQTFKADILDHVARIALKQFETTRIVYKGEWNQEQSQKAEADFRTDLDTVRQVLRYAGYPVLPELSDVNESDSSSHSEDGMDSSEREDGEEGTWSFRDRY